MENNEEMAELIESIKQNGVLNPVIVRPSEILPECYEIISGHRRCRAAFEAGLNKVPALVYEISRDEAAVMLVDSNIYRQNILPSEKAFAYKLNLDAIKHQAKLPDTLSGSRKVPISLPTPRAAERYSDTYA